MVDHSSNHEIGHRAEQTARHFLEKRGLLLIEKNFIARNAEGKKIGEIDLIMRDGDYYVFVEVKFREQDDYGDVLEMITPQKQAYVIRTATHFLLQKGLWDTVQSRFDVIGITPDEDEKEPIIWIKDAFGVQY